MNDLTKVITSIPFHDPDEWSTERLSAQLREWKIPHHLHDGRAKLKACLFCQQSEGNPAFGVTEGRPWYNCQRSNKCNKRWADVLEHFAPERLTSRNCLTTTTLESLPGMYPNPRETIVKGLIRRGDVVNLVGGPKARKSFFVLQLALAVASETPFLGRTTKHGSVLLIDNELRGDDLSGRAKAMATAMGLDWHVTANIKPALLRGQLADLNSIQAALSSIPTGTYSLIVVDALYKALPHGTDENSNSEMTRAYVILDGIAERQNAACVVVHHTSKGAQHTKSVTDMGAGAGAQSRSADVHLVLRDHEDENTVVLAAVVRSQAPVEPACLKFEYPLWRLAPDKDPENVAAAGKKKGATLEAFVATIPTEPAPKKVTLAKTKQLLGISRGTLDVLEEEAVNRGLIKIHEPKNKTKPYLVSRIEKGQGA